MADDRPERGAGGLRRAGGPDRHQPDHVEPEAAELFHEGRCAVERAAVLLGLARHVDLHEDVRAGGPPGDLLPRRHAVDRLPQVHRRCEPANLVALDPAEEVPPDVGSAAASASASARLASSSSA